MHLSRTESRPKSSFINSSVWLGSGSTKPAIAAVHAALIQVGFVALLFVASHSAWAQTETVLYNFAGGSDGASPQSPLTADHAGNFFGTTYGGVLGSGTAYELS